jgi:pheromone shutdown protein TraB
MQSPVLLLGAAHVADLEVPIRRELEGRALDGVALELDAERAAYLLADGARPPRPRGAPLFARLWSRVQRRLGAEIGAGEPGAEMKVAARVARERNLPLFLIDDPIRTTLVELVRSMPFKERVLLLVGATVALFVPPRIVEREMDRYADQPQAYTSELRRASPTLARVLLDDRNEHMADRLAALRQRGYGRIAVVVGDAHLDGLRAALGRRGVPVEAIPFQRLRTATGPSSTPA